MLDLALCTPDLLLRKASVMLDSTLDSTSDHSTLALTVPIAQRAPANTGRLLIGQIDKELYTSRLASYPLPQAPSTGHPRGTRQGGRGPHQRYPKCRQMPSPKDKGVSPRQPLVDEAVYRGSPSKAAPRRRKASPANNNQGQGSLLSEPDSQRHGIKRGLPNSWLAPARGSLFNSPHCKQARARWQSPA